MDQFLHHLFAFLATQPVLGLFTLIGIGMIIGHIKIKSISLGAASVLFLAITISAVGNSYGVEMKIPGEIGILGLAVFAFAIGINSGHSFFNNLKKATLPLLATLIILLITAATAYGMGSFFNMNAAEIGGIFAGSTTNTPALAAVGKASGQPGTATVSYSITYLFGVVGMLVFTQMALRYGRNDKDKPVPIMSKTARVDREDGITVGTLIKHAEGQLKVSRIRHRSTGPMEDPHEDTQLNPGDLITLVGPRNHVIEAISEIGHSSSHNLIEDHSINDMRRITLSNPRLAGRKLAELHLDDKFRAVVSRVRRGDVDMLADEKLRLQVGDRLRVVAPKSRMAEITKYFGDSSSGFSYLNPVALGLGMALGILIGEMPILTPTGAKFSIGSAAGTLIVGLVFGRIGRIGGIPTALPYTSCQVLTELGLLLFLAQAGANAGNKILTAFESGEWIGIFISGVVVTTVLGLGLYLVMRFMFKMGGTRLAGLLGGVQTQPAVLAFANGSTNMDPRVALGYSMVYPLAMVVKILLAQVLGMLG